VKALGEKNGAALLAAAIVLIIPVLLRSYAFDPPLGYTGAPGEHTCTDCHSGANDSGSVAVTSAGGYQYGTNGVTHLQQLAVTVTDSNAHGRGYEMTSVLASNTAVGTGTFSTVDTDSSVRSQNSKMYAAQTNAYLGTAGNHTYLIDWTPPTSNVGDILLYFAAVTGPSNDVQSPDTVYTGMVRLHQPQTLNVSVVGSGSVTSNTINCPSTCSDNNLLYNSTVSLSSHPATGWSFTGWSGACTGTGSCVVTMSQAQSVTATFAQPSFPLTVTLSGSGTVTSTDGFINCPGLCSHTYVYNTPVTLIANPAQGWSFTGWSGACTGTGSCVVTMSQAQSVGAAFSPLNGLSVFKAGIGTVTSTDGHINCGNVCTYNYPSNTVVTLNATAVLGFRLINWRGCDLVTGPTCQVTTTTARSVTAVFAETAQDFNGDLISDILWRNVQTGQNAIWLMNGFNYLQAAFIPPITDLNWFVAGTGDFDGDGKADILWRNSATGQMGIWFMNGTSLSSFHTLSYVVSDPNWHIVAVADFNGDGKVDILWRNVQTGQNVIWLMNGANVTAAQTIYAIPDQNWQVAGTGDFDGDGNADILWRNHSTGANAIWLMNGFNIVNSGLLYAIPDQNWQVAAVGDFDGDGKKDILWFNDQSGQLAIWLMNGLTYSQAVSLPQIVPPVWQVVRASDFNGDGKADILWRNSQTGQNAIWLMNGPTLVNGQFIYPVPDLNWQMH
jgi:hypothetical protein